MAIQPITEGRISKGGQNDPNLSSERPPTPQGSGGDYVLSENIRLACRVAALEEENRLLKAKLLDIEAYFQSGRR